MTTEQVQKSLEDKSPITRGSESHERTFEIEAVSEEGGIKSYITDIQVEEGYSPMHYDLQWSTKNNKNVPFVGSPLPSKEDVRELEDQRYVPTTPKPAHSVAVIFETINGDVYNMRWSSGWGGDLLPLLVSNNERISDDNPIEAVYEPTSNTGGTLKLEFNGSKVSCNRRAYEGEPDDSYASNSDLVNRIDSWIRYEGDARNGDEWVECPIVNAYESEDGKEISIVVESPLGEATAFEFEVTSNKSSPYWDLLNDLAQGDPANLSDSDNSVYLRHRSRSFYNLNVSEHSSLVSLDSDIVSIDVNMEWEMKTEISQLENMPTDTRSIFAKVLSIFN